MLTNTDDMIKREKAECLAHMSDNEQVFIKENGDFHDRTDPDRHTARFVVTRLDYIHVHVSYYVTDNACPDGREPNYYVGTLSDAIRWLAGRAMFGI